MRASHASTPCLFYVSFGPFLLSFFGCNFFWFEGAHPTTRDAGKIDFRAVHVVAQVAAHAPCRSATADCVMAHSW